jgi:8-oxo-dGTP pyrophosphatase MutT (NUDIX family)
MRVSTPKLSRSGEGRKQAWLLEVVAGIIDPGHDVVEIASKELLEEAGYVVKGDFRPIATIYPSPGWTSERIYLIPRPRPPKGSINCRRGASF